MSTNIEFLGGAGGEVTGSCYLVTGSNGNKILIDCGVFQGSAQNQTIDYKDFGFDPRELSAVLLSHAHLDHSGRLPALISSDDENVGFEGNIFMTPATKELTELILGDQMRVIQRRHEKPFYKAKTLRQTLDQIATIGYRKEVEIGDFTVSFFDAGHILGSSSIRIKERGKGNPTIVFSGDLGNNFKHRINDASIVVEESTYGNRNRPDEDPRAIIQEEINRIEEQGRGVLMIPAFSVGRTQIVQAIIHDLKQTGKINRDTTVRLDSPMAKAATRIHQKYFNITQTNNFGRNYKDQYYIGGTDIRTNKQTRRKQQPMVVIAGSGMMDGGKIRSYFSDWGPDTYSAVLFVGYLTDGSLGKQILEGAETVNIDGLEIPVNCRIRSTSALSSHLDQDGLLKWASNIQTDSHHLDHFILVHGEEGSMKALGKRIEGELNTKTYTPKLHEVITL